MIRLKFCCRYLLAALLWLLSGSANSDRIPLFFSYITTKSGGFLSSGAIPVVDLALEQINNRTDILPNYTLSYTTVLDSKCDVTAALDAFNKDFIDVEVTQNKTNPTYLSLLCCGCSTATIPVAQISHYWNIPHMAYDAAAIGLNDRKKYRSFFRTLPQYHDLPRAIVQIAMMFNWSQMAIVTQTENLFTTITNDLERLFNQMGWTLDTTATVNSNSDPFTHETVFHLKGDYRINFINTYPNFAFAIFCQAYHRNMTAPRYVWITPSWYQDNWWKENPTGRNCTPEMMELVLNGSLAVVPKGFFPLENDSAITTSGLSPGNFTIIYDSLLNETAYSNLTKLGAAGAAFDAVWAIATGLHNASERVKINDTSGCDHLPGELVPLEEFNYRNQRMGCVLQRSIAEVNIAGVTGTIAFNNNGSRTDINDILLDQYRIHESSLLKKVVANVAILPNSSILTFTSGENVHKLWPGGAPYDGSAVDAVHHNHIAMVTIYSTLTTAGLVYTLVCLVFNIRFRNSKIVKLSSPNLNYLIISGAALLYISVYMYVFTAGKDQLIIQTLICNLRQWFYTLGYTLCFAVILAKTWRVYHIFNNPHQKKMVIKDWVLLVFVAVVVTGDLIIITISTAVPSSRLNATVTHDIQHPTSVTPENTNIRYFVYSCITSNTIIWLAVSYAYKGLLQLVAMFMAFHTRRVKIKALNDSKEIAVIIYINSITLALLAVVEFTLNTYHEVYAALLGLGLMVGATLFLTLVFVPKMVSLCKDPEGSNVFGDPSTQDQKLSTIQKIARPEPSQDNELTSLRKRIAELENEITMNS